MVKKFGTELTTLTEAIPVTDGPPPSTVAIARGPFVRAADYEAVAFSDDEKRVMRRALRGYSRWCMGCAYECAQVTSEKPIEAVGQAIAESDAANALLKRLSP